MKLKSYISALLSALVLFSNIGLAFNVHYCHGRVSEVTLTYKDTHCFAEKQESNVMGCCKLLAGEKQCCKDQAVKIQDKTEKTLVKSLQLDLASFCVAEACTPLNLIVFGKAIVKKQAAPAFYAESNAPPLYKLYCRYVLYA